MVIIATTCGAASVGHKPSTNEESRDYERMKDKTQQTQNKAEETAKEAKEASESWTEWAKEKITEGLGFKDTANDAKDKANQASETVSGTAKRSKDNIQEVSSGNYYNYTKSLFTSSTTKVGQFVTSSFMCVLFILYY